MSRWFRHYAGMMRDEKLVRVAVKSKQTVERVVWVWGAILESASEINDNGRYELDAGEVAYFLRCDDADVGHVLAGLEDSGRIAGGVVQKWSDRQYESDTSRERQKRYRERKNSVREGGGDGHNTESDVTPPSRDAEVTLQENRDREQIQKDASASSKRAIEAEFNESFWPAYPLHVGKPNALKAYFAARKRANFEAIMAGVRRYAAERTGEDKQFTKQAQGWLNRDGWNDEPTPAIRATSPPKRLNNAVEANLARRIKRNEPASGRCDYRDAELLPPDKPELRALVGNLGEAMRWPERSGDH